MVTKIISHRGRTSKNSEDNTLQAINDAINLSIDMVEVDIRKTKDSQIICFHDPTLNGVLLKDMDYSEIIEINPNIPTLEQVLWTSKDRIEMDFEFKESGYEKEIISIILDYFEYNDFIVTSFNIDVVRKVKEIDDKIKVGMLLGSEVSPTQLLEVIYESLFLYNFKISGADFISPYYKIYEAGWINRFVRKKIPILVWTVNDQDLLKTLIHQEIYSVVTDIPEIALKIRKSIYNDEIK
jgi:glycerophosphoryl diester phosphodiesterase